MILVTGATGNVGGEVVRQLAVDGVSVRALTRRPDAGSFPDGSVEVVAGDLGRPDGLDDALAGVEALFLLGGFDTLRAVLDRAARAGVRRLAAVSPPFRRGESGVRPRRVGRSTTGESAVSPR